MTSLIAFKILSKLEKSGKRFKVRCTSFVLKIFTIIFSPLLMTIQEILKLVKFYKKSRKILSFKVKLENCLLKIIEDFFNQLRPEFQKIFCSRKNIVLLQIGLNWLTSLGISDVDTVWAWGTNVPPPPPISKYISEIFSPQEVEKFKLCRKIFSGRK